MPVDTTSPCPVVAVNTSPSAMSPPPLRHTFPCPDVLPSCPRRFPLQVAVPEVMHVCNVRKGDAAPLSDHSSPFSCVVPAGSANPGGPIRRVTLARPPQGG